MKFKFTGFKSCVDELPEVDGEYVVIRVSAVDGKVYSVSNILYTVAHGWNTFKDTDGEYHYDNALTYDKLSFWTTIEVDNEEVQN
jgi:hypothetical protein